MSLILIDEEHKGRRESKFISPGKKKLFKNQQAVIQNPTGDDIVAIMQLGKKSKESMENLANYCKGNERLMAILRQNSSLSQEMFILNLASEFDYICSPSNGALFNYGDIGDKFYIIIKGEVAILIPQEKQANLTYIEYVSYLCNLSKCKELAIMQKCIELNIGTYNVSYELIEKIMMPETRMEDIINMGSSTDTVNIYRKDTELKRLLSKSDSVDNLNVNQRKSIKRLSKGTFLRKLRSQQDSNEQNLMIPLRDYLNMFDFPENHTLPFHKISPHLDLGKNLGSSNQVNVSNSKPLAKGNDNLNCLSPSKQKAVFFQLDELQKLQSEKRPVKIYKFINVKALKSGDIFGDIALQTSKNKRTATTFVTQTSHFLFLVKQAFDDTIGEIHNKILSDKMRFLKTYNLFQYYPAPLLYENYYRFFNTIKLNAGALILKQSKPIIKTYFIRSGIFEVNLNASIVYVNDYLNQLGYFDDKFTLAIFHNESNEDFKKFVTTKRKFTISKLYSGEYAGLDYQLTNIDSSLVNIECISDLAEVFVLDNYDFFRLLNDYNSWKFSVLCEEGNSTDEIVTQKIENSKDQLSHARPKNYNKEDDITQETKIGNFLNSFNLLDPKNPVHLSFLNYCEVKRSLIYQRLFEIKRVYLERYMSKVHKANEVPKAEFECTNKAISRPIPNTTRLLISNSILPKTYLCKIKKVKKSPSKSSATIKTTNELLHLATYSLKDIEENKLNDPPPDQPAQNDAKHRSYSSKKPYSNKLSSDAYLINKEQSKVIQEKNSAFVTENNEDSKMNMHQKDAKANQISSKVSVLGPKDNKIVIIESLEVDDNCQISDPFGIGNSLETMIIDPSFNTFRKNNSLNQLKKNNFKHRDNNTTTFASIYKSYSLAKISKFSKSVKGELNTQTSNRNNNRCNEFRLKALIEKGISKFEGEDYQSLKQIKQLDKNKFRLVCSLSDTKKTFSLFESQVKAMQKQSLRNRNYRKEKESLY